MTSVWSDPICFATILADSRSGLSCRPIENVLIFPSFLDAIDAMRLLSKPPESKNPTSRSECSNLLCKADSRVSFTI